MTRSGIDTVPIKTQNPHVWCTKPNIWSQVMGATSHALKDFPVMPQHLHLGPMNKGDRILPCLTSSKLQPHQFVLTANSETCALSPMGKLASPIESRSKAISSHIDWFAIDADLDSVYLELNLTTAELAKDSIICLSFRDKQDATVEKSWDLPDNSKILAVPAISQMQERTQIRNGICSPACVTMLLKYHEKNISLATMATKSRHSPSGLFGHWVANMQAATEMGVVAGCMYCPSLTGLKRCLDNDIAIATSIKYKSGQLPDAPLDSTSGHVIVIRGFAQGQVLVNDPAASEHGTVARSYDCSAFANAWQQHHRIVYLLDSKTA